MIPTFDLANSMLGGFRESFAAWSFPTASMVLSNGDRTAEADTTTFEATHCTHNTLNTSTGGKFYWEIQIDVLASVSDIYLGVRRSDQSITSDVNPYNQPGSNHAIKRGESGEGVRVGGGWVDVWGGGVGYAQGDVVMFAIDCDTGEFWMGKNGTWFNSGDPAAGTNPVADSMPTGIDFEPFFQTDNVAGNVRVTLCTLPAHLTHSIPSGFTTLA